jgi:drug/metabolite transporter (DMT)-like permease
MTQKAALQDWMLLATLVVTWGSSFALGKHAVASLDASWVMALRLSVAAIVLIPYAYAAGDGLASSRRSWLKFLWLAFIGNAVPFFAIAWGMQFISSGVAGLLMGAIPLFVVALAHVTLPNERLTAFKAAGFAMGFCGIVALIGPSVLADLSLSGDELIGEAAILFGCVCYAVHGVSAKLLGFDPPARQSAAVCLLAAMMGLALALALDPGGLRAANSSALLAVVGLGLFPTALATVVAYRLMARMGPSFVSVSNYLVPVFAVALGAVIFTEPLHWNILAALLLILTGIAISRIQPATRSATQ